MLSNDDVPFSKLGTQIERDTVLAGNILKIVNSALYGREGTVTSIVHAISILGTARLRNCALAFSVNRLWNSVRTPSKWSATRFNSHSLATAMMADRIAEHVPVAFAEGAFAAGLFHDLGKLLIAMTSLADFDALQLELRNAGPNSEQREKELLGVSHSELSALALERWNLPKDVQTAVLYHHEPSLCTQAPPTLAHIVNAADRTVNDLGFTLEIWRHSDKIEIPSEFPSLEALHISDVDRFISGFQSELDTLKSVA
jgi:HD-like signal output (HDOD) protein